MTTNALRVVRASGLLAVAVILGASAVGAVPARRTRAEVDALVEKAGQSKPDWWDQVPLDYPRTLDLARTQEFKGWDKQHILSVYVMGVVNPDPSLWKPAAKLLHHVLDTYKDDPKNVRQTQLELAHVWGNLLGDYARGAYWFKKAGSLTAMQDAQLARFYRLLGDPTLTREIATAYDMDDTGNGGIIRMWSSIGDFEQALRAARVKGDALEEPDVAYLAAGDACRREGKFDDAVAYYEKVVAAAKGTPGIKRNKDRARADIDGAKAATLVDLAHTPDGTYASAAPGFRGDVTVEVVVKAHRVESVRVTKHKDDWFLTAPVEVPAQIVENQGIKGVDAVSGATFTSESIINAAAKALGGAVQPAGK